MNSGVLVKCAGVSRTYGRGPSAVVAVHGADCAVRTGQQIALSGPSGSGKSTLLHLLAGIDRPTTGQLCWPALGGHPGTMTPGTIGLVFQGPSLLPELTVLENVGFPLVLAGRGDREARARAEELLMRAQLDALAAKLPEEISGGQAQRVAVARALIGGPRLILADEPTGQLDHVSAAAVIDLLTESADRIGAGLLLTTHDPAVANRFVLRWTMADGRPITGEGAQCQR